ncbi:TPA: NUDIX hydrolase [archaeon]|uniref:NUDIX hydrolase n=1 Tax=Candidatus Naiadarchaeum limnaeum TaxID=2756139 RepID=A0A832UNF9_9ARCH|nr:NUDIX hydrolase [Candidatus Naiadarchaeum limnaeum]
MSEKYPKLAVDVLIADETKGILLVKRKTEPFKGRYALPGGMVEYGETVEKAAVREVKEETGLDVELEGILGVYSDSDRDPRGHTVSLVFFATPKKGKISGSTETEDVGYKTLKEIENLELAFDHETIVEDFKIIQMDEEEGKVKRK